MADLVLIIEWIEQSKKELNIFLSKFIMRSLIARLTHLHPKKC